MIVIAHLSDIHIDGGQRSVERTRAVMSYLNDLPYELDLIAVTGDIADHGLASEYEQARELLASRHPVLACPGNHDQRAAFRQVLLGQGNGAAGTPEAADTADAAAPVNQVYRGPGFVVALCDSSVPGQNPGHLDDRTLAWLDGTLAEAADTTPVIVGFHHPPAELASPLVDQIRQFGAHRLADLAGRHPRIVAFLSGHAHAAAATTFAGRPLLVAPGVVSAVRLPWERRSHPEDHVNLDLPPAVAFHVLHGDGRLTTHYRSVIPQGCA